MPYTVTKNGKTYSELDSELDALTIYDIGETVMSSVHPMHEIENINTGGEDEQEYYDNLRAFTLVVDIKVYATKLLYVDFVGLMGAHIGLLKDSLIVEFDELQRVNDLTIRLDALKHWSQGAKEIGQHSGIPNFNTFKKIIIDANDTDLISALEAKDVAIQNEYVFQIGVEEKVARMVLGQKIIATINKMNDDNTITIEQLTTILTDATVSQIMQALETGSLLTAKGLMQLLDLGTVPPMDESYRKSSGDDR